MSRKSLLLLLVNHPESTLPLSTSQMDSNQIRYTKKSRVLLRGASSCHVPRHGVNAGKSVPRHRVNTCTSVSLRIAKQFLSQKSRPSYQVTPDIPLLKTVPATVPIFGNSIVYVSDINEHMQLTGHSHKGHPHTQGSSPQWSVGAVELTSARC